MDVGTPNKPVVSLPRTLLAAHKKEGRKGEADDAKGGCGDEGGEWEGPGTRGRRKVTDTDAVPEDIEVPVVLPIDDCRSASRTR